MTKTKAVTCLCGSCHATYDPAQILWTALCHCESCRRATGAPVVGWFGVANGAWAWAGAPPQHFESTQGRLRYFCGTCGSPMGFQSTRWPGEFHFLAATMESPQDYTPHLHCWTGEHLGWLQIDDDLPRYHASAPGNADEI